MSWNSQTAQARIQRLQNSVPATTITVRDFADDYYRSRGIALAQARSQGREEQPITNLPYNQAVMTHGVHVYINLVDFNAALIEAGRETERSHERALGLLHVHYSALDRLFAAYEVQRVDYHGGRAHAVVLTPEGPERERERIEKALSLADAIVELIAAASNLYDGRYSTGVRIGIDSGPAVAINSGKALEQEPLFIGNPANYAAKLAAGAAAGILLSPHVDQVRRSALAAPANPYAMPLYESALFRSRSFTDTALGGADLERKVALAFEDVQRRRLFPAGVSEANFSFHRHEPPLKSINFADLSASRSIRMEMATLFADIDGFTRYVSTAISTGNVRQAVANLHVIRGELAAVLRDDFGGRKVRFIGDCLQGVLAVGDRLQTESQKSVERAVLCAGGMRSSFDICKQMLPGAGQLGIAIGLDFGPTPVTRIGLRGESSVRASVSRAVCSAELIQSACDGRSTALADEAFSQAGARLRHAFGPGQKIANLDYDAASAFVGGPASPGIVKATGEPLEAHCRT